MSASVVLDTDREQTCFICGIPIWPSEPKIVLGTKRGLYVVHPDCAPPKDFYEH